jgi:AcrR family transcriptional regulator
MPRRQTIRNRAEKRAANERRIVQAAAALFAQQGFGATTMRQIAEKAKLALGTLYNYAPDKLALLYRIERPAYDAAEAQAFDGVATAPALERLLTYLERRPELSAVWVRDVLFSPLGEELRGRLEGRLQPEGATVAAVFWYWTLRRLTGSASGAEARQALARLPGRPLVS